MTDSNRPIDLQTLYRIANRDELVRWISLCLAEDMLLEDPRRCIDTLALHLRLGFQSLHERTDDALLLLAEDQSIIDDLLESCVLRETNVPPLLEWMEKRAMGGSR
jgi:hypothetical protein